MLIPYGEHCLFICPAFHLGKKIRQFLVCSQFGRLYCICNPAMQKPFRTVLLRADRSSGILANHPGGASVLGARADKRGYHAVYNTVLLDRMHCKR